jgi:chorismate mutase
MRLRLALLPALLVGITVIPPVGGLAPAAAASGATAYASDAGTAAPTHENLLPLVQLSAERVLLADKVAAAKWGTNQPIDDPAREQHELDSVAAQSVRLGIDPVVSQRIFRDQIEASKVVQRGLYRLWSDRPELRPTRRPDLSKEVRPALDRITVELLEQIRDTQSLRVHPSCGGQLIAAFFRVGHEMRLDPLHSAGLARAVPSVCTQR